MLQTQGMKKDEQPAKKKETIFKENLKKRKKKKRERKKNTSPLKSDEIRHTSKSKLPCRCQFLDVAKSL
jgi:hypothetical protein